MVALWSVVFLIRSAVAGDTGSPPTPAAAPPGAFDSMPLPSGSADVGTRMIERSDRVRFMNEASSHYSYQSVQLLPDFYFFPPNPPSLGAALRLFYLAPKGVPAPPELANYVNEPFYPVLGVRLAAEDLPPRLQAGLAAYRAAKVELQNGLRSKIARLAGADTATRRQELASLAHAQTPRIVELEATAAQLRTDLQRNGVYGALAGRGDWNEGRKWRLAPKSDEKAVKDTLQMEFEVMRAAIYYEEGLSSAQRRLVREIAMELQAEIRHSGEPASGGSEASSFFFSPETARISVPADLPAGLAAQIAAFVGEKKQLKVELRDALRTFDGAGMGERTRVLRQLAASQAPRIAALEERAEDIRRGLAGVPNMPGPPAPPPLPDELAVRISSYRSHKLDLLKPLHAMLAQPTPAERPLERTVPVKEQVAIFNREHAAQFAQLMAEKDGIREALGRYLRSEDRKSIGDLLEEFENSRQEQEIWERYRDYQVAVLLPGLSPEQRRLLFDAAVEELALPLPTGEAAP
jgi:hypothetical protein